MANIFSQTNQYIGRLLKDVDGNPSSKRFVLFVFLVLTVIATITELFTTLELRENTMQTLLWIDVAGAGIVVAERFAPNSGRTPRAPEAPTQLNG